uniref:Myosin_tail_1 domain-containing protein n=1 Tax=Steinernema glaseri TaxID=37863 RepID=A0A1I7ZLC0_9BILA
MWPEVEEDPKSEISLLVSSVPRTPRPLEESVVDEINEPMAQSPAVHNRYWDSNDSFRLCSSAGRCTHESWDVCEMARLEEINETRNRSAQMERTMRWWTECTANWRGKWKQMKDERNWARAETEAALEQLKEANEKIDSLQSMKRRSDSDIARLKAQLTTALNLSDNKELIQKLFATATAEKNTQTEEGATVSAPEAAQWPSNSFSNGFRDASAQRDPSDEGDDELADELERKVNALSTRCSELETLYSEAKTELATLRERPPQAPVKLNKEIELLKTERDEAHNEVETLKMEKEFLMQQLKMLKKSATTSTSTESLANK